MRKPARKTSDRLTKYQLNIFRDVEEIAWRIKLDYQAILAYERDARTPVLEHMRRKMILSEVITSYTLTDEHLNLKLCRYFFGKKRSTIKLWRTKKFQRFNHHVLEEISLMAKLRFLKAITAVPKSVARDIELLNSLRNGLAHSFFPENLKKSRPEWKGKKIYTAEGFHGFLDDMSKLDAYFLRMLPGDLSVFDQPGESGEEEKGRCPNPFGPEISDSVC